jgi:hypothetical protein
VGLAFPGLYTNFLLFLDDETADYYDKDDDEKE